MIGYWSVSIYSWVTLFYDQVLNAELSFKKRKIKGVFCGGDLLFTIK